MKILAALFLSILAFLAIILFIPRINSFTTDKVKEELNSKQFYALTYDLFNQQILSNPALSQEPGINAIIQQAVTQDYLQQKIDQAITQSGAWIVGASQTPPTLSFNDLKQQLIDQHPQGAELEAALKELGQAPQNITSLPQVSDDPQAQAALEQVLSSQQTLQSFSQGDLTIHLEPYLGGLKLLYQITTVVLIVLPIIIILYAAFISLRQPTLADKLRTAGKFFTAIGLASFALVLLTHFIAISWGLASLQAQLIAALPILGILIQSFTTPLLHNFLTLGSVISLSIAAIGFILWGSSKFINSPSQPSSSQQHPNSDANPINKPAKDSTPSPTTPTI